MASLEPASTTRIAARSLSLLGVHLDTADAATGQAVAGAVERLADALVSWHDAVAAGDPDHRDRRRAAGAPGSRPTAPVDITPGVLERVAASAQVVVRELAGVARAVTQDAGAVGQGQLGPATSATAAGRLREQGLTIVGDLDRLAEVVAELGTLAERERRGAGDPDRTATRVRRAEQAVRRTADALRRGR